MSAIIQFKKRKKMGFTQHFLAHDNSKFLVGIYFGGVFFSTITRNINRAKQTLYCKCFNSAKINNTNKCYNHLQKMFNFHEIVSKLIDKLSKGIALRDIKSPFKLFRTLLFREVT